VWGFAQAAQKRGVEIHTFTDVTGFEMERGEITGVVLDRVGKRERRAS